MTVGVAAIVTAYDRVGELLATLGKLHACVPPPSEILVHVDGGKTECADAVRRHYPNVAVLISDSKVGPGGARNRLMRETRQPLVASFDDDSSPMDTDFFNRVAQLFANFPDAWVVAGRVFHVNEPIQPANPAAEWAADFSGGGCAYRRERYLEVGGYVPLASAYNMEEVDFALRLHGRQGRVLATKWLRVFHNTDLARHADPEITASSIANLALLAYLRYPIHLWVIGLAQCANRIQWLVRNGRGRGIVAGVAGIPGLLWRHRRERTPLAAAMVKSYFRLRREPRPVPLEAASPRAL